jgi:heme/copper-type cytochrome/quinol oxidase subunit 2
MTKKSIIITIITLIILITLAITSYFAYQNYNISDDEITKKIFNKLDNPQIISTFQYVELIKNEKSSFFNPQYTLVINANGNIGGYIATFDRQLPFLNLNLKKENFKTFTYLDKSKSFEEIKTIAKQQDLSKITDRTQVATDQTDSEEGKYSGEDEYFKVKYDEDGRNSGKKIKDYYQLVYNELLKTGYARKFHLDRIHTGMNKYRMVEAQTLIFDNDYPNVNFVARLFDDGYSDEQVNISRLKYIFVVMKDKRIIEVPIVNNQFDWQAIDKDIKK